MLGTPKINQQFADLSTKITALQESGKTSNEKLEKDFEALKKEFNECKIKCTEAIPELEKQVSDLQKADRKTKCHKYIKRLFSNWFLWIIIMFFALGITMFLKFYPITDDEQVSVVLAFVGIAATFVVVSNYAQVKDIENKFNEKAKEIKNEFNRQVEEAKDELTKEFDFKLKEKDKIIEKAEKDIQFNKIMLDCMVKKSAEPICYLFKLLMPLNKVFWAYIIDIMRIIA